MEKNKKILVSIITVVFNGESTIKKTIESVLNQSSPCYEYIIQDGCSTDKSLEIAQTYQEKFDQKGISYQIVSEKDKGVYDAMNQGIKRSSGEIVGMINSDDFYELDAIKKVVQCYKETEFDMMYGDVRLLLKKNQTKIKKSKQRNYVTTRDWNHPSTFVKKSVYEKHQYRCQSIYDDFDFLLKIKQENYKIVILNEVLANFKLGGLSNEKNFKKMLSRAKERYKIYRNNGYSPFYFFESYGHEVFKYLLS